MLAFHSTGNVSQARIESTRLVGVSLREVASTDSDFATANGINVVIPNDETVFEATVSGTATQANVGNRYDLTATSAGTAQAVNLSGTTYGVVTVVKFINSSTVWVKINGAYQNADINT